MSGARGIWQAIRDVAARLPRRLTRALIVVWIACVAGGLVLPRSVQIFDFVEKWLSDLRVAALTPPTPQRSDIVLLTITEETLTQFPYRSPIDRSFLAEVVEHLDGAGARAIGLDILIDQPTEPEKDARLAQAVAKAQIPVIIGWADLRDGLTLRQTEFLRDYLPEAVKAHVNLVKDDRDGTVRWSFPGRQTAHGFRPGFATALAATAGIEAPSEPARLLYRRGTDGSVAPFATFPVHLVKVLPQQWFANKIVVIGADLTTEDRHRTPYATLLGNHDGSVPGVVIHALTLAQLLDGEESREGGIALETAVLGLAAFLGMALALLGISVLAKIALAVGALGGLWFAGFAVYAWGGPLMPIFVPSVAFTIGAGLVNAVTSQRYKKQKDLAEMAVRARSEFLAMMSHEIRTPLNGILGVIEMLKGSSLNKEQEQMATIVQDSGRSLLRILNDILDFSKIEADKVDIHPEPTSLRRLTDGVIGTFATLADKKGIRLDMDMEESLPDWVTVDSLRLRQVLVNLLGNAIKFTEKGGVTLSCRRVSGPEDAGEMLFVVQDTGIGMSQKAVERLFQPFTQADGTTTRRYGGTGLGLSISLKLIGLMDGRIDVTSKEGEGSSFSVYLPLHKAEAPPAGVEAELPEIVVQSLTTSSDLDFTKSGPASGRRVLVAEDDPTSRWLVYRQLTQLGYEADLTENGRAAFETFQKGEYEAVITDFHMPEMDGLALTRAIRGLETDSAKRTPIMILSADAQTSTVEECRQAGVDDVLTKPTQISVLRERMNHWVGQVDEAEIEKPASGDAVKPEISAGANGEAAVRENGEAPVLNMEIFVEMFGGVNDEVKEALAGYVEGGEELAKAISKHASKGDAAALSKTSHRLAGESMSAGAVALGDLCRELEAAAEEADWQKIGVLEPQIDGAFEQVKEAIANL